MSPCTITAKRYESLQVTISKPGCTTQTAKFFANLRSGDLGFELGVFAPAGLVDIASGAHYYLYPNSLTIKLACDSSGGSVAAAKPATTTTAAATVSEAPAQPMPSPTIAGASAHWVGQGERDGCDKPYAVEITVQGHSAKGRVDRDGIAYAVNAGLDLNGDLDNSLAALADPARASTTPGNLDLNLRFEGQIATGAYSTFDGNAFGCTTDLALKSHQLKQAAGCLLQRSGHRAAKL